jgi:hypothetical protein
MPRPNPPTLWICEVTNPGIPGVSITLHRTQEGANRRAAAAAALMVRYVQKFARAHGRDVPVKYGIDPPEWEAGLAAMQKALEPEETCNISVYLTELHK